MNIQKVCVIGAGVMGQAIASHMVNARLDCLLLDIKAKEGDPNSYLKQSLQKIKDSKPSLLFSKKDLELIKIGNIEDDFNKIKEYDLIIEAVAEKIDIKKDLFKKLENIVNKNAIIASNTSGLFIKEMTEGLSEDFKSRFLVMHFFNPVRYLHLLEVIPGEQTKKEILNYIKNFGEKRLGKGVIEGKDTPNFVANRIGIYAMMEVFKLLGEGVSIEELDAIFGPALGRPKSAIFRTADVVGLDTLLHVAKTSKISSPLLEKMVEKGLLGQKSGAGFYKKSGDDILVLDTKDFSYKPKQKVRLESLGAIRNEPDLKKRFLVMAKSHDKAAQIFRDISIKTARYALEVLPQIADSVETIDNAMKWGFGWQFGPIETVHFMGLKESLPPHKFTIKEESKNIVEDAISYSLLDSGTGALIVEFHSKMNAIEPEMLKGINRALDLCEDGKFNALVLANEGENFSVGANILLLYMAAMQGQFKEIEEMVNLFQKTGQRLKYSNIPTIAAPFNMTFGGGLELSMWCDLIHAQAEAYLGLVEVGVGLVPGGGGNVSMLERSLTGSIDSLNFALEPFIQRALETVAMAKVSTSALEAKELLYLRGKDSFSLNKRFLITEACKLAIALYETGYLPPKKPEFRLPGNNAFASFEIGLGHMVNGGFISEHDFKVASKVAYIMTGGKTNIYQKVSEDYLLELEREAFLSLCGEAKTLERIAYMLENNKPLRN